MINQEIYILTKHGRFQAEYVENLPIYRRRFFLELFQKENDEVQKEYDKINRKSSSYRGGAR
jgi:hypothetical protein